MRISTLVCAVALLGGCTWVKLTEAGAGVAQADAADVTGCRQVGTVSAQTRDKVLIKRGGPKVREELLVLARNKAADLGGDTIVPQGPPEGGSQDFRVFACRQVD